MYLHHSFVDIISARFTRRLYYNNYKALVKDTPFVFLTSHLESGTNGETAMERKNQLAQGFDEMVKSETTAVFGGDLKLRNREVRLASS